MHRWISLALQRTVLIRSAKVGLVVGTFPALINYADRVLTRKMETLDWMKLSLTYIVPYLVSTYASVADVLAKRN